MCWAFNIVPSQLPALLWRHTLEDLETKLRLSYSWEMTKVHQEFETLAIVVSRALGGSKPKPKVIQSEDELVSEFSKMFGAGSVAYG